MYSQRHIDRQDIHAVGGVVGDLGDGLADDGCKVRVHFPDLPEEERAKRKNALMKAAERFLKHAERVKKEKAEQENMPEAKEG